MPGITVSSACSLGECGVCPGECEHECHTADKITVKWSIELTESYEWVMTAAEAQEIFGTTDPAEINEIISDDTDAYLPEEETDERSHFVSVDERYVDSVEAS